MMNKRILVRGGGDLATGVIHRLYKSGFQVVILECQYPTAIRRKVSFCEAVYEGTAIVEGVICRKIEGPDECEEAWAQGEIPLLVDPQGAFIKELNPQVVVDGILAKKNLGTKINMAPLTIGLGPGFSAGEEVDFVVETKRGHDLGRIIEKGSAYPNTGVPGIIGGYGRERVIHAPTEGTIRLVKDIGCQVEEGEILAYIDQVPVKAPLSGVLRGIIRDGFSVNTGLKIADIDPRREEQKNCFTISDKARCIAGSVLELVCRGKSGE